jgi:hypothetical protein
MVAILLLGIGALVSNAAEGDAIITLGVLPLPPDCVVNPGGTATIDWSVQYQTVPDYVTFTLYDPTHTIVYDSQTYPGATGVVVTRTWTVPSPLPEGFYWVRIEYYSVGIGLEAWAETGFLLCEQTLVCCLDHTCIITTQADCELQNGYWHPEWLSCDPNPCDIYTPTEESTWGEVKSLYR